MLYVRMSFAAHETGSLRVESPSNPSYLSAIYLKLMVLFKATLFVGQDQRRSVQSNLGIFCLLTDSTVSTDSVSG